MIFLPKRVCPVVSRFFEINKYNNVSSPNKTYSVLSKISSAYSPLKTCFNHYSCVDSYRQLNRNHDRGDVVLIKSSKTSQSVFRGLQKSLSFGRKSEKPKKKRVPKLILLQNPLTWLMIKIDFSVLRNIWDPCFVEKDFKFGTKQVV